MELRRSQRQSKFKTIWEERGVPSAARDLKITKKTDRTVQKTTLKSIIIEPLSEVFEFDVKQLPDLSIYELSLTLRFTFSKSLVQDLLQFITFQQLLTSVIIDKIVESINSYVKNIHETNSVDENDFKHFIKS